MADAEQQVHKKYVAVLGVVLKLLSAQTVFIAERMKFEDATGTLNGQALGYVYGFADAALQITGLEIDHEYGHSVLVNAYEFFAEGSGTRYFAYIVQRTEDPEVQAAILKGGEEYYLWVNSEGKIAPWGLGRYFGLGPSVTR